MAYPITKFCLFYPLNWIMVRNIKGIENVPNDAIFIIVSNHEHLIDPLYMLHPILKKLNKKIHFLSSARWWFLGDTICRKWAGCIPIFNSEQVFEESMSLLESGEIVGIFPEGRLNAKIRDPKTGAIRLALETKTPILPIGLKSSYIPFNSAINIGKPIHLKKKNNIKKQMLDLMKKVYRLRNSID